MKSTLLLRHGLIAVAVWCCLSAAPRNFGQVPSLQSNAEPTKPLSFDVVSVRRSTATGGFNVYSAPDGDSIVITNMSPHMMIGLAYDLPRHDDIIGLPSWTDTETFDITAKVAESDLVAFHRMLPRERNFMLQPLLADRFHLVCHYETRQSPVYNLVVAKGGVKLTATHQLVDSGGHPLPGNLGMRRDTITSTAAPLSSLAEMLSLELGRPVIDKTGLSGAYTFTLHFTPVQASTAADAGTDSAASIFSAIEDQLGLRLESGKGPVRVLIVDHIEHPSEE